MRVYLSHRATLRARPSPLVRLPCSPQRMPLEAIHCSTCTTPAIATNMGCSHGRMVCPHTYATHVRTQPKEPQHTAQPTRTHVRIGTHIGAAACHVGADLPAHGSTERTRSTCTCMRWRSLGRSPTCSMMQPIGITGNPYPYYIGALTMVGRLGL